MYSSLQYNHRKGTYTSTVRNCDNICGQQLFVIFHVSVCDPGKQKHTFGQQQHHLQCMASKSLFLYMHLHITPIFFHNYICNLIINLFHFASAYYVNYTAMVSKSEFVYDLMCYTNAQASEVNKPLAGKLRLGICELCHPIPHIGKHCQLP